MFPLSINDFVSGVGYTIYKRSEYSFSRAKMIVTIAMLWMPGNDNKQTTKKSFWYKKVQTLRSFPPRP